MSMPAVVHVEQHGVDAIPGGLWDVLVVGAGPAGSTAARQLAARGHRVLIVDRDRFPREKVCGDALTADAIAALHRAGLLEQVQNVAHRVVSLKVYSPAQIEVEIPGHFLTLRRCAFDALMARSATTAGAVFCLGAVEKLDVDGDGRVICCVAGATRAISARAAIVATGAHVGLLDRFGLVTRRQASGVAMRCYIRSSLQVDSLVFSFERTTLPGYRWIFPLGQGQYNLGCISFARSAGQRLANLTRMYNEFIDHFPLARQLVDAGDPPAALRGGRVRCGLTGVHLRGHGPILGIGETIGTTFPVSGEGVGKAMETAELAADVVAEALDCGDPGRLRQYADRLELGLRSRYRSYDSIERWLSKPWLNNFVLGRLAKSRRLREAFSRIVDDCIDPRTVFSWPALWKSLWG